MVYPVVRGSAAVQRWLYVPPALGVAGGIVSLAYPAWYGAASSLRPLVLLLYLAAGTVLLARSWVTTSDRALRRGVRVIVASTLASVAPLALLYAVPVVLGQPAILAAEPAASALVIMPAGFAYAMLRHDALQAPLLQRWLVHAFLWCATLSAYMLLFLVARDGLVDAFPTLGRAVPVTIGLTLVIAATYRPLYVYLKRGIDRRIFRDVYDYRQELEQISATIIMATNLKQLADTLAQRLCRLMNLEFAALLMKDMQGADHIQGMAGIAETAETEGLMGVLAQRQQTPSSVWQAPSTPSVTMVQLRTPDGLIGHLCLGPRKSAEPLRAEDHALVVGIASHLAATARNLQLVTELQAKVVLLESQDEVLDRLNERLLHAQEEERRRIAADLHDEPLQTAQQLQRMLAGGVAVLPAEERAVALSASIVDQLRNICNSVRPAALDELGLAAALQVLARDLSTHFGVPVRADTDPELQELSLPPSIELILYRAAQEAVNNSLHHARPTYVGISLVRVGEQVRLRVTDNGTGFAVPTSLDSYAATNHLGLAGLSNRVRRGGGTLHVRSAPGQGTVVEIRLEGSTDEEPA